MSSSNSSEYTESGLELLSQTPDSIGYQACYENGVYHVEIEKDGVARIKYWDQNANQDIYLCASPNCEHKDDSCTAYLSNSGTAPAIACNGKNIFLFHYGIASLENPEAVELSSIEMADLDGGNRKTICTLKPNQEFKECFVGNDTSLYMILTTFAEDESGSVSQMREFVRLDLNTKEITSLKSWDDQDVFLLAADEQTIVLKTIRFNQETNGHILYHYNTQDGTFSQVESHSQDTVDYAADSWLFYFTFEGNNASVKAENWKTGDSFKMDQCIPSVNKDAGLLPIGLYDKRLFVSTVAGRSENGENLIIEQYAIDVEKKTVSKITTEDAVIHRPLNIVGAIGADRSSLVLEKKIYHGDTQSSFDHVELVTIPVSDFIAGSQDFVNITAVTAGD